jgi:hypothetical protein
MKKYIALLILTVALCASAAYAADNPSALSQTTDDGITTIITTGRAQADISLNADGSLTFTVYPAVTRTSPSGKVIGTPYQLDTSGGFPVTLPSATVQAFLVQIKAAYTAKLAAEAAAKSAAAPTP